MKKKGFTLIELIAVISILAIIALITVPFVKHYIHKAEQVKVKVEASEVIKACYTKQVFLYSHDTKFDVESGDGANVFSILMGIELNGKMWYPMENWLNVGEALGWYTTIDQLKKLMQMPIKDIPIENGTLKKINGQADLS